MPEQGTYRGAEFLHRFDQDLASALRCSNCPGFRSALHEDCLHCGRTGLRQDVKPENRTFGKAGPLLCASFWTGAVDISAAPLPQPAIEDVAAFQPHRSVAVSTRVTRGRAPIAVQVTRTNTFHSGTATENPGSFGLLAAASRTSMRLHQDSRSPLTRRSGEGHRGRPLTGKRLGSQHGFKGVRTRKGVKGFLVEIRPPKWKRTIWLGTYNTSAEAAGAYDAGIFYTKKANSKYNFRSSEGAFPPLPPHLRLDNADNMEEIKNFVQQQAQEAARRVKSNGAVEPGHEEHVDVKPDSASTNAADTVTASSSPCRTEGSVSKNSDLLETAESVDDAIDIPMDLDYLMWNQGFLSGEVFFEDAEKMVAEYASYFQQSWLRDF